MEQNNFGNVTRENEKSCTMEELMLISADRVEIRRVTDKMNELLYGEELMCLQHSRIACLKDGGRNTKFFYSKLTG